MAKTTRRPPDGGAQHAAITRRLQEWRDGDAEALPQLMTALYSELRRMASGMARGEPGRETLRPTALVHELYSRLPALQATDWQSRGQFLNVAATVMRNLVVDFARRKHAAKRGGGVEFVILDEGPPDHDPNLRLDALVVHELLIRFEADYPRQAKLSS